MDLKREWLEVNYGKSQSNPASGAISAFYQGIFSRQHSMQRSRGTSEQEDFNATTLKGRNNDRFDSGFATLKGAVQDCCKQGLLRYLLVWR